jgi:hypothetical protein
VEKLAGGDNLIALARLNFARSHLARATCAQKRQRQ